jgi:hypothetical protein
VPKGVAVRVRARACPTNTSSTRQRSSVVEHPIRNRAVVSSILTAGSESRKSKNGARLETGAFVFSGTRHVPDPPFGPPAA